MNWRKDNGHRLKRLHMAWFYLYDIPAFQKRQIYGDRSPVASLGEGGEMTAKGREETFGNDEDVWYFDYVQVSKLTERVKFTVCEL